MSAVDKTLSAKVFEVNDLEIAGLHWESSVASGDDDLPLLCLHGWLDNAASFLALGPLLGASETLAVDMAGHGQSSHRSLHGSYNIWDDLEDLVLVIREQGWERVNLLGHSRGGFVAVLLAAIVPELIGRVVLLDAFLPAPEESSFTEQMGKYLRDRQRLADRKRSVYTSIKDAVDHRSKATPLSAEELRPLVERDLQAVEGGFGWRHDSRLHGASAVKLIQPHLDSILASLDRSITIISAEQGLMAAYAAEGGVSPVDDHPCFEMLSHPGKHHFHMERQQVGSLSDKVNGLFGYASPVTGRASS